MYNQWIVKQFGNYENLMNVIIIVKRQLIKPAN